MQAHLARRLCVLAIAGVIAVTVGGSAAAHPGSAAAPKAGFTLTVGTTLSLTGDGAVFGPAFQKSAEMAVDMANKALVRRRRQGHHDQDRLRRRRLDGDVGGERGAQADRRRRDVHRGLDPVGEHDRDRERRDGSGRRRADRACIDERDDHRPRRQRARLPRRTVRRPAGPGARRRAAEGDRQGQDGLVRGAQRRVRCRPDQVDGGRVEEARRQGDARPGAVRPRRGELRLGGAADRRRQP